MVNLSLIHIFTVNTEVEVVTEDEDGNEVVEMQEIEETTLTICLHHTTPELSLIHI